ncbi:MAG: hypothetical protein ACP5E2_15725 [Terracidiphilus sp.]
MSLGVFSLLVSGYMFYVARLSWIGFIRAWKSFPKPLRAGVSLTYAAPNDRENFDEELLWETQLPALALLSSAGTSGVSEARMTKLYNDFARIYPELYDGSTFMDWIDALQNAEVAVHCRAGDRIAITEKGRSILAGLERKYVIQNAPLPFPR